MSADKEVDPTFKLVFSTAVGLTVLVGTAYLLLSLRNHPSDAVTKAAGTFSDLLKLLTGALAGLLGGKSLA